MDLNTLLGILAVLAGGYVGFVVRRMDRRAERQEQAWIEMASMKTSVDQHGKRLDKLEDRVDDHAVGLAKAGVTVR